MKTFKVTATLEAPLAIKRDRQSDRSGTAAAVGGSVVRGALARTYLDQRGVADETFQRIFLDETACRFGPLDPAGELLPRTAVSCKRHPGFLADGEHGVADQLWMRIAGNLKEGQLPEKLANDGRQCRHCGADVKPLEGFYSTDAGDRGQVKLNHRVAAHVGIDRLSNTAAEAILYTIDAFAPEARDDEPARLVGWFEAEEEVVAELDKLLEVEDRVVYMGHARTRGYGRTRLDWEAATNGPEADTRASWQVWSDELNRYLAACGVRQQSDSSSFRFSLSLPAGAVLIDRLLRYSLDPADMIAWLPALTDPRDDRSVHDVPPKPAPGGGELRYLAAVATHERIRGWNAAHGLPRQDEWAVGRGAVYAYQFDGTAEQRDHLMSQLAALAREGIGLRRNEGFGRVVVCDPFHQRFFQQETRG
jgi:CRISPR-associated protein Csx10